MNDWDADVAILGGGAAGLVAAVFARASDRPAARVVVLEAAKDVGRKILVSGGGRCNVLPMRDAPGRFVSASPPRLVRRFLDRFPLRDQRLFFEEMLGGPLREEPETFKLFPPSNRSKDVRDALVARARAAGAAIRTATPVRSLEREGDGFRVTLEAESLRARQVIVTTGGLSVLAGGADGRGFDWAAALGHTIRPTYAALAPMTASGAPHASLSGVSFRARVRAAAGSETAEAEGGFLFTHRGYSGPSVLDVSHVVERASRSSPARVSVRIAASGGDPWPDWDAELRDTGGTLAARLSRRFPDRVVALLLGAASVTDGPLHRLTREDRRRVVASLEALVLPVDGTEGYRTAEVTGGGVPLEEVDPGSGRSRLVPGLFFAGEILDAFGPIGGFNFQWAWATGRSAGLAAGPSG